jgi:uncharacterized protein
VTDLGWIIAACVLAFVIGVLGILAADILWRAPVDKSAVNSGSVAARVAQPKQLRFGPSFLARANKVKPARGADVNPFSPPAHPLYPPGVMKSAPKMAMDEAAGVSTWAAGAPFHGNLAVREGFLGYPFLAELALLAEYRNIVEVIATECTRRWIKIQATGDDVDKTEKIKQLEAELIRLSVRDHFRKICEQDGYFGRAHLYVDTGDTDKTEELLTSIGNGRDAATKGKIRKGSLKALRTAEAVWVYPLNYNVTNPLKEDWYRPTAWGVWGTQIHATRLLTFVGREVGDLLKPAYCFGGQSMTQIARPYVDNWLKVRQGVTAIINAFSVFVLKTNLTQQLNAGVGSFSGDGGEALFERAAAFNLMRSNEGLMIVDKEIEDFANVSASLAGLEGLQAQAQEHMASVSRIPIVKLLGIQPDGLNASSEGELQSFEATIGAYQERFMRPHLTTVIDFAMINLWGAVDEEITFVFEPLEPLNEKELAEVDKIRAEADQVRIEAGVIWPEDARKAVAANPATPYPGLNPDDVPTPPMTETGEPFNARKTVVEPPENEAKEKVEA